MSREASRFKCCEMMRSASSRLRVAVPEYDHHCAFLRNTIGRDNYAAFFATVLTATATCALMLALALVALQGDGSGARAWVSPRVACQSLTAREI